VLWFGSFALFPKLFFAVGVNHFGVWFLDTFALLASNDAVTLGRDPYVPNNLDYFHRPHVYSHWWLHLRDLGLTRAHTPWVGFGLVVAFLGTVLSQLRPRSAGELFWYTAVFFSSSVLLALDRANNDLVIFLLLSAVLPALLSVNRPLRFGAALPIAIATGLKFYPAVAALVLTAGTEKRERLMRVLVMITLLVIVGVSIAPDIARSGSIVPRAEGLMTFGAINLLEWAGLSGRQAMGVALVLAGLAVFAFLRSRIFEGWTPASENRLAWLSFVLGASLLTGCFFAGTNYAYRWIFAIWLAPFLWLLAHDATASIRLRRLSRITAVLLLFVLWSDAVVSAMLARFTGRESAEYLVQWADKFFLLEQPMVWAFFFCLLGFLAHFTREQLRSLFAGK
jgi:hypothetical protein